MLFKMVHLQRTLNLVNLLSKKSFFLFGPRATGKTFLIKSSLDLDKVLYLNLLHNEVYSQLSIRPEILRELVEKKRNCECVVIDEIQRLPILLNEVHALIEEKHIKFLLTGSSAHTLRRRGVNLLAGRAWEAQLYPLTWSELAEHKDLGRYLQYGGLPAVYLSSYPEEELHSYVYTYLKEEIQAETFIRKIAAFSKFLQTAALTSGQVLNFANIASDTGIPASTVREYYHILEDTFLGFMVPAWTKTLKRKPVSKAKFYFFDIGVKNTLAQITHIDPKSDLFGQAFEHFIMLEVRAYLSYRRIRKTLSYWGSTHGEEVDLIIGDEWAIEVKTTHAIQDKHLKNLKLLREEEICQRYLCISFDPLTRSNSTIELYYWEDFLRDLWADLLISS